MLVTDIHLSTSRKSCVDNLTKEVKECNISCRGKSSSLTGYALSSSQLVKGMMVGWGKCYL
jgi:hypothetical protein